MIFSTRTLSRENVESRKKRFEKTTKSFVRFVYNENAYYNYNEETFFK